MAFFGTALAHTVLLGIALGLLLAVNPLITVFASCLLAAACLAALERQKLVSLDALLGVIAHIALALGLVLIAFMEDVRVDLMSYLFGDVLSIGITDLWVIYSTAAVVGLIVFTQWRKLLSITIDEELAAVEGTPVALTRGLLVFAIAVVIAVGMKVVGMLLVVALVIIPAATARRVSSTPEQMVLATIAIGVVSVIAGLYSSLLWDLPAGPAIVLVAGLCFIGSLLVPQRTA